MKKVLISIRPGWCEAITSGKKTVEIRKTIPKLPIPFKCYIYCTKSRKPYESFGTNGKPVECGGYVIGEFVCDKIEHIEIRHFTVFGHENRYAAVGDNPDHQWLKKSCLSYDEVVRYGKMAPLYGWHISNLVIYDKPKPLSEFYTGKKCNSCKTSGYESSACPYDDNCKVPAVLKRPPQSWCYVEGYQ